MTAGQNISLAYSYGHAFFKREILKAKKEFLNGLSSRSFPAKEEGVSSRYGERLMFRNNSELNFEFNSGLIFLNRSKKLIFNQLLLLAFRTILLT